MLIKPTKCDIAVLIGFVVLLLTALKLWGRYVVSRYEKEQKKKEEEKCHGDITKALCLLGITALSVAILTQPVYAQVDIFSRSVTITFDTGFADYQIGSMEYTDRHAILPTPTYDGYIFEGWYEEGKPFSKDSIAFSSIYNQEESICLKAKWIKLTKYSQLPQMTIHFDAGCHKIYNSLQIPCGTEPENEFPVPEYPGHVFKGWFAEGSEYTQKNICEAPLTNGNVTLTAKWEDDTPVNRYTEKTVTPSQKDEQTKSSTVTETFSNGSRVVTTISDTVMDNHVVSSRIEKQLFYTDGDTKKETSYIYYGYNDYMNSHSEDEFTVEVVNGDKEPIEGVCIKFHIGSTPRAVYTDKDGMATVKIEKDSCLDTEIRTLPYGYHIESESPVLGYGCLYSIIYRKRYVLSDKKEILAESSNISGTLVLD